MIITAGLIDVKRRCLHQHAECILLVQDRMRLAEFQLGHAQAHASRSLACIFNWPGLSACGMEHTKQCPTTQPQHNHHQKPPTKHNNTRQHTTTHNNTHLHIPHKYTQIHKQHTHTHNTHNTNNTTQHKQQKQRTTDNEQRTTHIKQPPNNKQKLQPQLQQQTENNTQTLISAQVPRFCVGRGFDAKMPYLIQIKE